MKNVFSFALTCLVLFTAGLTPGQQTKPHFYQEVSWSPNGSKLSLSLNEGDHSDIYVMQADGSQLTKLTIRSPTSLAVGRGRRFI
jgi:hypothetical protein